MSRYRDEDLAYGDLPQRWDRARFERFGTAPRGAPPSARYEDDFRATERERPGRANVTVAERERSRAPSGRFFERDDFFEEDRYTARAPSRGPRRRTDRELFGDVDPKEFVGGAMQPYRPQRAREELDIEIRRREDAPRPGLLRRQSSLDTFDRRPARYEREEYRVPPYAPVPLPIRREERGRFHEPEDYREVEIQRERSVHRKRPSKSKKRRESTSSSSSSSSSSEEEIKSRVSKAKSRRAPSVRESVHETIIKDREEDTRSRAKSVRAETVISKHETIRAPSVRESAIIEESVREERRFKKGKTRMPKRMVELEAIMDLGYPFDEEKDFFVLRVALDKDQIDEVIRASEVYRSGDKSAYRSEAKSVAAIPPPPLGERDREEITRTEWINPPTLVAEEIAARDRARSRRGASPSAKSSISRRHERSRSRGATYIEERHTTIEERRSFEEDRGAILEERRPSHGGALIIADRETRSDRDIAAEIRNLEIERRALRLEREADQKHALAERIRHNGDELQLIEFDRRPTREVVEFVGRERSPPRNVIRVEKDRKGRLALVRSAH